MSVSFPAAYEQVKAQVGKVRRVSIGTIAERDFQRFAVAASDTNPLFFDEGAARAAGLPGVIAPPLYLSSVLGWEAGPPGESLRPDGTPSADPMTLAIEGFRVMGGGQDLEFHAPVTAGSEVTMEFSVTGVELKQGRSGQLLVVGIEKRYLGDGDQLLITCRENFIAR